MKILNLLLSVAGENESLKNLRLTVLGTASGGDFVSALALKLDVFAAVLVVSHGSEEAFKAASKGSYPPTLFVHLPKEGSVGDRVKAEIKALQSKGTYDALLLYSVPLLKSSAVLVKSSRCVQTTYLKLPWNSSILAIGKHLASLFHFILLPLIGEIAIDHFQFERKI